MELCIKSISFKYDNYLVDNGVSKYEPMFPLCLMFNLADLLMLLLLEYLQLFAISVPKVIIINI